MKPPVRVAVTGAAGQISYALLFRIASGDMLGHDQPVILQLLEIPPAMEALQGTVMEIEDGAFPLVHDIVASDEPEVAFGDADFAMLVGARPRGPGMERKDLLTENARIFSVQGAAIDAVARRDIRVLVVGNPANTNALIAASNAPSLDRCQFTAMTRLDHNRAISQLAVQTGKPSATITRMSIWGNHSATQYPDIHHATVSGKPAIEKIDREWLTSNFIPVIQQRGASIINARGSSSAASAASAAIDHMRDWILGTPDDDWVSMGIPSNGSYGIKPGIIFSYPVKCINGGYEIIKDLEINNFSRKLILASEIELREERAAIEELL